MATDIKGKKSYRFIIDTTQTTQEHTRPLRCTEAPVKFPRFPRECRPIQSSRQATDIVECLGDKPLIMQLQYPQQESMETTREIWTQTYRNTDIYIYMYIKMIYIYMCI